MIFILKICYGFGQQTDTTTTIYLPAKIVNGDTIIEATLPEVVVGEPRPQFENRLQEKQYWRLVNNLKKVMPYAKMAKQKLDEMNAHYLLLKSDKEKKKYAKEMEDQIRAQFENQLKNLTITQGKLLIKLIYRETGSTSYDIVKEFRGGLSAMFWQALARLFGSSLKTKYDPQDEDMLMEQIVQAIEQGVI